METTIVYRGYIGICRAERFTTFHEISQAEIPISVASISNLSPNDALRQRTVSLQQLTFG